MRKSQAFARLKDHIQTSLQEGVEVEDLDMEDLLEGAIQLGRGPKLNIDKHEMMTQFESRVAKLMAAMERDNC